jgi:hypothetical protein
VNIYQTDEATKPGRIYREALMSIVKDVKEQHPPELIAESWLSFFLRYFYLKEESDKTYIVSIYDIYDAKSYEVWLENNQQSFPNGTIMISGSGSCVYYGCHNCGFRLRQFISNLDPRWHLLKKYNTLSYLPVPEAAALWVWSPR